MKTKTSFNNFLLEKRVNFYKTILNQVPDLIFQLTISLENDFYFSYLNKNIISFFEVNKFELHGTPFEIISNSLHPDDKESFFESLFNSKNKLEPWTCEFRVLMKNKGVQWFKVEANVESDYDKNVIFYCSLTNINIIKIRELRVQESETRYQFALEASKKGIWDFNVKSDKVFFSKESLEILQLEESDNICTNAQWDAFIHPEDKTNYQHNIQTHIDNKSPYFESTKRLLSKDGTYKWVLSTGKIIERDKNGKPLRIIGTHTDVTSLKEKENELRKNLDIIVEQNNRLLNFAHIVSHNLRSHTGNFQMLLNMMEDSDDLLNQEECLVHLKTTSNALSETIDHLKELVDIQNTIIHKKEDLNLRLFLNNTLEVLSSEIKENKVKIVNKIGEKETVKFNPAYLESLFLNFTTNAIKYSHPDRNPEIRYSFLRKKGRLMLLIEDNGLGINLDKYGEKLFGMYKTFHKNADARGIGLFITKNQIESMGGSIEVESKVNVGTTFKINFNEEV